MRLRPTLLISCVVALVVAVAGIAYSMTSSKDSRSTAELILAPSTTNPNETTNLINSFENSGSLGNYLQLLTSDDLLRRAGSPNVSIGARQVPNTRVIEVTAQGDAGVVKGALTRLVWQAQDQQGTLRDLWDLRVLQSASNPETAGAPRLFMIAGSIVLALLASLLVFVVLRRLLPAVQAAFEADAAPPTLPGDDEEPVALRRVGR